MTSKTLARPVRPPTDPPRRVSFADRVALRIGLALIVWSRRTRRPPHEADRAEELRRYRERQERLARETAWATRGAAMHLWR